MLECLERGHCQQWWSLGEGRAPGQWMVQAKTHFKSEKKSFVRKDAAFETVEQQTCAHLPTCDGISRKHGSPGTQKWPANIRPRCPATRDLTNHQPHSARLAMPLSSVYRQAANRNHPLYECRPVSRHRPFVEMDVNED